MERINSRRLFALTIQKKLLLILLAVALIPFFVFGSIAFVRLYDSILSQVASRMQATSKQTMSQINHTFGLAEETVASWARLGVMQAVAEADPDQLISGMFRDYQHTFNFVNSVVAVDSSGLIVAAGDKRLIGASVAQTEWFTQVRTTGRQYRSLLGVGRLNGNSLVNGQGIHFAVPIFSLNSGKEFIGAINVSFDWQQLVHHITIMDQLSGQDQAANYAVLINREGYVIAAPRFILDTLKATNSKKVTNSKVTNLGEGTERYFGKLKWLEKRPELLQQLTGAPGVFEVKDGSRLLMLSNQAATGFSHLKDTGWTLVVVHDAYTELRDVYLMRQQAYGVGALAILIVGLVSYLFSRQFAKPIARLSAWAEELSKGRLDNKISVRSKDELADLAGALDHMRCNLRSYFNELVEAKELYQNIIDSIDCLAWEVSLHPFEIVLFRGNVEAVLGCSTDQVRTRVEHWKDYVEVSHQERVQSAIQEALTTQRNTFVEFKIRHDLGSWVWVKVLLSVIVKDNQAVGLRGIAFDISNIVQAAENMAEARDMALKNAEDKNRFMALVSHEIRTPMNGMLGMLELLQDQNLNLEQKQTLDLALESGRNLLSLVGDVVDYTRLVSGELEVRYDETDLPELLSSIMRLVATDAYAKGLDLGLVIEVNMPSRVWLDSGKLRRILVHLLVNAVKFTHHGSVVLWAEVLDNKLLYVEIKDTGVGIQPERQIELFAPFTQADLSTTRRYSGTGLGLAVCRGLLELMGGNIGVRSIENVGSSFCFSIPLEVNAEADVQSAHWKQQFNRLEKKGDALLVGDMPATQVVIKMACEQWGLGFHWVAKENQIINDLQGFLAGLKLCWILVAQDVSDRFWDRLLPYLRDHPDLKIIQIRVPTERYGQRPMPHLYAPFSQLQLAQAMLALQGEPRPSVAAPAVDQTSLPRVLVVDDNEVNRRVACGYLRKLGFSCDIAEDGLQALEAIKVTDYHAIFMDCQMPVMDGYQATQAIRQYLGEKPLPIIAITANAMLGDREKCLDAGMDDYIAKPLKMDTLQQVVSHWLPQITSLNSYQQPKA